MKNYLRNPHLDNDLLPADIVLAPDWWHRHAGIVFDEDFYYNPARRVEAERRMEQTLHDRWGQFGLGADCKRNLPLVGPTHLAAGYLLSEMLGCKVIYKPDTPPQVVPAGKEDLRLDVDAAFESPAFKRFENLLEQLKTRHGGLAGDVNFGGVLNLALDLRGETLFMDLFDKPDESRAFFSRIAQVIERFVEGIEKQTGSSSISVNRCVKHIRQPVYLHSECSHTMISVEDYEKFLMDVDMAWSRRHRPYGIHYCGKAPHRYAETFAKIGELDFLDAGWGGDIRQLRRHLPRTFLNIRLSPVELATQSVEDIEQTIRRLVSDSDNPYLTGVCCINLDATIPDEKITAVLHTVQQLRAEYDAIE